MNQLFFTNQIFYHGKRKIYMVVEECEYIDTIKNESKSKVKSGTIIRDWSYTVRYLDGSKAIRKYYQSRILSSEIIPVETTETLKDLLNAEKIEVA